RETIESIAMAVILALLFRGFVAEAFVIPTGSMAPTLQGRHKDVQCPKCDYWYQTSASAEENETQLTDQHVYTTTCPICRYTQTLDPLHKPNDGSFSGDRIIVGKFCYDLAEPRRWDVIVFKFPGGALQNYIKRLIGLPGEKVWIVGGNIHTCGLEEPDEALKIARKPPHKLDAMLQIVDDTDHIPAALTAVGWPLRWSEQTRSASDQQAWKVEESGKIYVCEGTTIADAWLRFRNLVPSHSDWELIESSQQLPSSVAQRQGQLITDFYAYNTARWTDSAELRSWINPQWRAYWWCPPYWSYPTPTDIEQKPGPGDPPSPESLGQHWVDDLAVECLADVSGSSGELLLDLVRAGVHHECRINLADGVAKLTRIGPDRKPLEFLGDDGKTAVSATAQTPVKGPGRYRLRLSNCDHEVLLWVNGSVMRFDGPTTYYSDDLVAPVWSPDDPGDLAPAGLGSRGAAVKLSQLRILRDKYYIAATDRGNDYKVSPYGATLQEVFANPQLWESSGLFADENRYHVEFTLEKDQFLPLGDNSPASSDGRFWINHHYVERELLIGKALLIYWPHTWNRPVPFLPNVTKMQRIR
ncbi:MAG: S26 family signal peptidase, partial [Planctomycetaceae bacterium]|nr:S26 family signal peptidase [Planctomycetaceae bacterium]